MKVPERFKVGISRYQPSDAGDLAAFQRQVWGDDARQLDRERFAWLFGRNPVRSDDGTGPGLWVCRRDGAIVGQQAEIPFVLLVGGKERPAAWAIDLMVDPDWRLRGVGPGLAATQLEGHDVVAGLTQADEAFKSYVRGGWTDVGVVPTYVRPIDARRFLGLASVPSALRRWAPVAGPALRAVDAVLTGTLRATGAHLVEVERFDERLDQVWTAAAADYPVIARRDAGTTAWRLDDRPDADRLRRFYLVRRRRPLGYVALRTEDRWGGVASAVVDYLAPRRWVAPLLTAAANAARRDQAFALVCRTLCQPADRALRAAGFVRRGVDVEAPLRLVAHCTADDETCGLLSRPDSWFLTAADSDLA